MYTLDVSNLIHPVHNNRINPIISRCFNFPSKFHARKNLSWSTIPAFIALSLDIVNETFDAYFGTLYDIQGNQKGINMSEKAIKSYECIAKEKAFLEIGIEREIYADLQNKYKKRHG